MIYLKSTSLSLQMFIHHLSQIRFTCTFHFMMIKLKNYFTMTIHNIDVIKSRKTLLELRFQNRSLLMIGVNALTAKWLKKDVLITTSQHEIKRYSYLSQYDRTTLRCKKLLLLHQVHYKCCEVLHVTLDANIGQ